MTTQRDEATGEMTITTTAEPRIKGLREQGWEVSAALIKLDEEFEAACFEAWVISGLDGNPGPAATTMYRDQFLLLSAKADDIKRLAAAKGEIITIRDIRLKSPAEVLKLGFVDGRLNANDTVRKVRPKVR